LGLGGAGLVRWVGEGERVGTGYLAAGAIKYAMPDMKWNVRRAVHGPMRSRPRPKVKTPREAVMNAVGTKQTSSSIC
jgi:hypothetical protein